MSETLVKPAGELIHFNEEMTAWELAEWDRRTAFERGDADGMEDPLWRLANIYQALQEDGRAVDYVPTPEQRLVLWCIYGRGWLRLIIPKARQLGMSLTLCLVQGDGMTFREGFKAAWIDKTWPDAKKKMKEKIQFAFERIPAQFRAGLKKLAWSDSKAEVVSSVQVGDEPPIPSTIEANISYRGGTVENLVVSEWGWVQAHDRLRSREIKAGAVPAVERAANGLFVIETTWEGGLDGEVGPYVLEAFATPPEARGPKTWRILFFGWHTNPLYQQSAGYIDADSAKYFLECERRGLQLSHEQKLWYAEKRRSDKRGVKKEYPSFVHECWESVPEGSIYGIDLEESRAGGRICDFLADKSYPVHAFWDLGHPFNTVTWLIQVTPKEIRVLDVLMEKDVRFSDRAALLRAKCPHIHTHYIPWDGGEENTISKTSAGEFKLVFPESRVRVVQRTDNVWNAITATQRLFPRFVFHATNCATGIEHLGRYRSIPETTSGAAKDVPVHDKYSHAADAFRQCAQAIEQGLVEHGQAVGAVVAARSAAPVVKKVALR